MKRGPRRRKLQAGSVAQRDPLIRSMSESCCRGRSRVSNGEAWSAVAGRTRKEGLDGREMRTVWFRVGGRTAEISLRAGTGVVNTLIEAPNLEAAKETALALPPAGPNHGGAKGES
jgi:hypothetical protein